MRAPCGFHRAFPQIEDARSGGRGPTPAMLTDGYSDAFMVGAGIALLGVVAALTLIRNRDSRAHVELESAPAVASATAGS